MKTILRFVPDVALIVVGVATIIAMCSCSTATRVTITNPQGTSIELVLPKDLSADGLDVNLDPQSGKFDLKARKLRSNASNVIERQSAGVTSAIGEITGAAEAIVPLVK